MRNLLSLFLAIYMLGTAQAQDWTQIDLGFEENFNHIHFMDESVGYILGDNGLLLRTTDGGDNWQQIETGASHNLRTISFANDGVGYINGLKTIDGGQNWITQSSSAIFGLVHCIADNRIIAGHGDSFSGDIYESADGGETWEIVTNPLSTSTVGTTGMYNECFFVNDTDGYLVTWYSGHLFRTTDAGLNWSEIIINEVDGEDWSSDDYRSVYFPSEQVGLVTHEDGILKTTDGANTWSEIGPEDLSFSFYPESVIALSLDHYILVGGFPGTSVEKIYETTDGGTSWIKSALTTDALFSVACLEASCFAAGTNGTFYRIENEVSSVGENLDSSIVSIYPNPAKDYLNIRTSVDLRGAKVYSSDGKLLQTYPDNQRLLNIAHLSPGVYLLRIDLAGQELTYRFLK